MLIVDADDYDAAITSGTAYDGPVDRTTLTVTGIGGSRDVVGLRP